jgi:hypothetical protein
LRQRKEDHSALIYSGLVSGNLHYKNVFNISVQELTQRFPGLAIVFIKHHLACIGCSFSKFHNLHQALTLHRIDDKHAGAIKSEVIENFEDQSLSDVNLHGGWYET